MPSSIARFCSGVRPVPMLTWMNGTAAPFVSVGRDDEAVVSPP